MVSRLTVFESEFAEFLNDQIAKSVSADHLTSPRLRKVEGGETIAKTDCIACQTFRDSLSMPKLISASWRAANDGIGVGGFCPAMSAQNRGKAHNGVLAQRAEGIK